MLIVSAIITGLGVGSMYGLLALGYNVTYSVSKTVNFAQGSAMMLGAVLCYSFAVTWGWNLSLSVVMALVGCGIWGIVVERIAVRPFSKNGSLAWLLATLSLGIVLENVVLFTYGKEPRMLPSLLPDISAVIGDLIIIPLQIVIPVIGLLVGLALHFFTRFVKQGKAMRAVVQNPDYSRSLGINVRKIIIGSYITSTVFAGIAGILIAPLINVSSEMGTVFGIKAFAVAILGGIQSAWGVMVAGIIYGLIEALVTAVFGSPYTHIVTFTLVIIVLAIKPNGLFGRAEVKKV